MHCIGGHTLVSVLFVAVLITLCLLKTFHYLLISKVSHMCMVLTRFYKETLKFHVILKYRLLHPCELNMRFTSTKRGSCKSRIARAQVSWAIYFTQSSEVHVTCFLSYILALGADDYIYM